MTFSSLISTFMLLLLTSLCHGQNLDEWLRQKKTQRKYLLLQIAKLQVHIENVKKGYEIVKDGLNLVGQIKDGDFKLHDLFFQDLERVKPAIRKSPKFIVINKLYLIIKQHCSQINQDLSSYQYLSPQFKVIVGRYMDHTLEDMSKQMQSAYFVAIDGEIQMSDDERFKRLDDVYQYLLTTKQTLQADHKNISLYNFQRRKSLLTYQHLQYK